MIDFTALYMLAIIIGGSFYLGVKLGEYLND